MLYQFNMKLFKSWVYQWKNIEVYIWFFCYINLTWTFLYPGFINENIEVYIWFFSKSRVYQCNQNINQIRFTILVLSMWPKYAHNFEFLNLTKIYAHNSFQSDQNMHKNEGELSTILRILAMWYDIIQGNLTQWSGAQIINMLYNGLQQNMNWI